MERYLNAGDHLVLYERNRALVDGRASRVPLDLGLCLVLCVGAVMLLAILALVASALVTDAGALAGSLSNLLLGLFVLGGAAFCAAGVMLQIRDRARLEACGRLLSGEVTKVEEGTATSPAWPPGVRVRVHQVKISYRFLTPTGEQLRGDVSFLEHPPHPLPSLRDQLVILYADGINERVM